ncbi:MAG: TonB-dependent receptor plug domain-containing protein [Rubrivivax sp.]
MKTRATRLDRTTVRLARGLPLGGLLGALTACGAVWAQPAAPALPGPPAPAASAPTSGTPSATKPDPAAKAPPAAPAQQRIEVTGGRADDTAQRQRSTAAKIVIGREEIDKFGDATLGEVLRRLPGVTTPGAPGRGGPPRLRGLGGGYTQILIDGQRIPPGLSVESLTPEQIERIEILRAPTAETGARAIAGTINIITREGFRRRLNDLRVGLGLENGTVSPGVNWTHNDSKGPLTYNVSGSVFRGLRKDSSVSDTRDEDVATGATLRQQIESAFSDSRRTGVNLSGRLAWRLGQGADSIALMPTLFHSVADSARTFALVQPIGSLAPLYDSGAAHTDSAFTTGRLNLMWRQRLGGARLELNGGLGGWRSRSDTRREEFTAAAGSAPVRTLEDSSRTRQQSMNLNGKLSTLLGGPAPGAPGAAAPTGPGGAAVGEHSVVAGVELEAQRRTETRTTLQDGRPLLTDFGDNLQASSTRLAVYAQNEWSLNPNWAAHAGLRWEGIATRGDAADGSARPENRSSVVTPLLHAVWKPDPKGRDQLRLSLTRSYKSPDLGNLIARPSISTRHPAAGPNTPTAPDRAGNPDLRPEVALGVDVAVERYLEAGGIISANLFSRRISDLMRSVTTLETVSWSPVQRYVARTQNIGDAVTQGIELEAKFRLDQAFSGAPRVEMRSNLSLFRSRVDGVPGPDNRLDSQAKATANLGADYRIRGTPLTLGGNVNWVPGYRTQLSAEQVTTTPGKRVWDAFALWTFNPAVGLRVLGSNLSPRDYSSSNTLELGTLREAAVNTSPSFTNWQVRLELKL